MPNLNSLILTAADYKVIIIIPGAAAFPLLTVDNISHTIAREEETIYAVGTELPIGNKRNAAKYSGRLSMQNGELNALLSVAGLREATQIAGATISITAVTGGFARTYSGLNINSENLDVKAKDKQSMVALDWTATAVS